ncbi:MAG: nuclear transport factor 2 family protein [Phycisphaerales bacterium]|nr:nuclear transport factor 2 family protein [Phycisphaerales bacterium]
MRELLFDTPWWLPAMILLAGAALFITSNSRRQFRLRTIGLGVVVVGMALMAVSYFVDTPAEKCLKNTRALIAAFQQKDWTTFQSLLDPRASVAINSSITIYSNREDIVQAARRAQEMYQFTTARVLGTEAVQRDSLITVTLTLYTDQQATMGRPFTSTWKFEWQDFGKGWTLWRITALRIAERPADQLRPQFPRR